MVYLNKTDFAQAQGHFVTRLGQIVLNRWYKYCLLEGNEILLNSSSNDHELAIGLFFPGF